MPKSLKIAFIALLLCVLSTGIVKADYMPLKLYQMILKADRIVYGEIVSVDSLTFALQPEWSFDGNKQLLTILKFVDWPCSQRWAPYSTGQKLFVFLDTLNGTVKGMGPGIEHEMPVWKDSVYINQRSLIAPPPPELALKMQNELRYRDAIPSISYTLYEHLYVGYKSELQKFILTINNTRNCLYYQDSHLKTRCSDPVLERMALKDRIFRWAYNESNSAPVKH